MGWTKDEVDKYVAKIERNINSPREKNLKGFAFARLYREARDHAKATRHLEAYLSVNESDFRGHRMMGQLYEETGNLEKALLSYRRSLDLNNTQHDLVLKVVELYCQVPVEPGRARAWADRAARLYPGHAAVFKLRMHLLESVGKIDYEQMEDLISEEMAKRPRDAELHIRLIKVYTATGRLVEAYSHCASVVRTKAFNENTEWWMCAVDVFEKYMAGQDRMISPDRDIGHGHVILDAHAHLMAALSQLLHLYLKIEKTRDCINLFYRLDHCLTMAHERKVRNTPRGTQSQKSEWGVVLAEMRGQLYLHCATLILKLAKENYLTWPRALKLASVSYTTCSQVLEPDITTAWVAKAPKNKDALRWYHMACYRLSHSGHILGAVIHRYGEEWLDNCISDWCTQQGQDEILSTIYGDHQDQSKSFLANDEEFFLLDVNLPSVEHLIKYDEVCVGNNPRNLELITWIGLHWYQYEGNIRPGVGVIVSRIFDGLRMDVPNIEQTAADTLCLRDLEAFIYAVIRTSASKFLEDQDIYIPDYQPQILPQQLCDHLTSPAQEEWWLAAYNLYAGAASTSHAGQVRATVQRGLEVIRALDIHGLHVRLLLYLAFNFGDKASYLKTAGVNPWYYEEHWKSLQGRSLHYWKEALMLLEKIERNESIPVRKDPLFPSLQNSLMKMDVKFNIQKARLILGEAALRDGKIEEAMEMFEQVKTIQGMWNLAQIYKYLANVEAQAAASEDLESDAQSNTPAQEYYNCLNKAKELLLACMEKVPSEERRRQTLQDELNDIEDMLNEDPNRGQVNPRKQLDFRQLDFQASRSSTTVSDVQESEDNFWLDQPQDASSKDLIAKLSEVTLNNGYLQEQMAVRDQHLRELNNKVESLESELRELKRRGFSTNHPSPVCGPSITAQSTLPTFASPVTQGAVSFDLMSTTPMSSRQETQQNGRPLESTPVAKPSVKSRLGPRIPVVTPPEAPKIDSKFFAGLSQINSPEKRADLEKSEGESEQGSVRHDSTSFDEDIHFDPIIPLPKKVEKKTGEESEKVLFNKRAKLYRYDKDLKSWKERGIGNLKILSSVGTTRFRILMRREHILKICANHLITKEMELKPLKAGSQNSLVWTTAADFADESPKVEQLAVRFKLPEETAEFKEVFESCKSKLSSEPAARSPPRMKSEESDKSSVSPKPGSWKCSICSSSNSSNTLICVGCGAKNTENADTMPSETEKKDSPVTCDVKSSLFAKFAPKPGSWECSDCLVINEKSKFACVSCGARKPGSQDSVSPQTSTSTIITRPIFELSQTGFVPAKEDKGFSFGLKQTSSNGDELGTPQFNFGPETSAFNKPATGFSFALPQDTGKQSSVPFEFNPKSTTPNKPEETKTKKVVFGSQPVPFSFAFQPSSTSSSPLTFNFGKTQAPSFTLAPFGVSTTTPSTSSEVTSSSSPFSFSFGAPNKETPKSEGTFGKDTTEEKPLTFTASPSNALPGFDIDNDEEEEKVPATSQVSAAAASVVPSTIPPQLFWQQQLEEKFKFGNLHKTEPLAGMAPTAVVPSSGKPDALYPASFVLSKMASKSAPVESQLTQPIQTVGGAEGNMPSLQQLKEGSLAHGVASQGPQRPELLMSLLQSKPKETPPLGSSNASPYLSLALTTPSSSNPLTITIDDLSKTSEDIDDYSDDLETESEEETDSYHSSEEEEEDDYSNSYEEDPNKTVGPQPSPTTHQLVLQGQNQLPMPSLVSLAPGVSGRKFLTARSPLKKVQTKEDDCLIIYEIRAAKTDRDKASRLLLPLNFFNYARSDSCPGCLGCDDSVCSKLKEESEKEGLVSSGQPKPEDFALEGSSQNEGKYVFGTASGVKSLSFASFSASADSSFEKKDSAHHAFPMAGQQLFGSTGNDDASEEADIHFKPLIPLPDLIKVTTGEEDHTLLFSERAKLYRFDASSSMWKERGVGDIKLLLDNKSGRGRVVMRRDQIHKLCANHWITEDLELRTNSTSDRSWVWQTLADFSEETPSQEKLAVRFKLPETAARFKDEFDDLVALAKKKSKEIKTAGKISEKATEGGITEPKQAESVGKVWTCQECYCFNNVEVSTCIACGTQNQSTAKEHPSRTTVSASTPQVIPKQPVCDSVGAKSSFKPVFTIGRGDAPEEEFEEETYRHSPSKNKISAKTTPSPAKPATSGTPSKPVTGFALGSLSHTKFEFRLELTTDEESSKSSVTSPQSPTTPESPGSHPEAEDHSIHFEPIIPLPKKVTKKTGEENEEILFCQRAKLYRYDSEGNQWKERGLGDIKILRNTGSGKIRIIMRRDNVLKICANHQITPEMTLKPNAGSEKSWVWSTLADFAEEVAKQETLAVRFKTSEIAMSFKDAFEKAKEKTVQAKDSEGDGELVSSKEDTTEVKENAETSLVEPTESQEVQKQTTSDVAEQDQTSKEDIKNTESNKEPPQSSDFLFGSSDISSLSFSSVASNIGSSPGIIGTTKSKDAFKPGPPLFSRSPARRKESESEGEECHEDPYFEPLIPLPEKVEVRTGEEEEEVIFSHRAKLYRFDRETKQWKERGVGDIKILLHKKNGRVRILMRRDQILKICANHYVTAEMKLKPNGTSTKSWVWNTLADFSEEEVKAEQLAVRFKLEETAREFKEKFDQCQEKVVQQTSELVVENKDTDDKITNESPVKAESTDDTKQEDKSFGKGLSVEAHKDESPEEINSTESLLDKFKPKPGAWECETCMVQNKPDSTNCVACKTPKPGQESGTASNILSNPMFTFGTTLQGSGFSDADKGDLEKASSSSKFVFGLGAKADDSRDTLMDKFRAKPGSWECESCLVQNNPDNTACVACQEPKPGSTAGKNDSGPTQPMFTFGASSQETKKDSIMDKFKPNPGVWECETCLISNTPDSTNCAACSTARPGYEASQTAPLTQNKPAFNFGGPKATGFTFGFGKSDSSTPVSFGGVSFGAPPTDSPSQKPQFVFGSSAQIRDKTPSNAGITNMFGFVPDSSNGKSELAKFSSGAPPSEESNADKEKELPKQVTETRIQPQKETKVEKAEADSTDATDSTDFAEIKEQDEDLTLTSVIEPSDEEKRRAQSLLLPEGFFLYERNPTDTLSSVDKVKKASSASHASVESKPTEQKETKRVDGPKAVFGSSSTLSFSSFSDVSSGTGFQFSNQKSSKGFAGQGTQLFSSPQNDGAPEDEHDIYFKPLVTLPEIEVVTGEENEEKLFGHRAKLYRYDKSLSQWKERGFGEIKLLRNKNGKKFRVLMRRDQIHKLCANHNITTDMSLVPNAGNDRSWVWHTSADFSEDGPQAEQLAVRFKLVATAQEFKKVFEECQKTLREQKEETSVSEVDSTSNETDTETVKVPQHLSSKNDGASTSEVDSTSNKADAEAVKEQQVSKLYDEKDVKTEVLEMEGTESSNKRDGASSSEVDSTSNEADAEAAKEQQVSKLFDEKDGKPEGQERGEAEEKVETPEPDTTASDDQDSIKAETLKPTFLFGTQSVSSLSFSDVGKAGIFGPVSSSSESSFFKGLNDQKQVEEEKETDDHDDVYHNLSGDHIHFEPIIPLPDKVDVVTGEENEEVVFKERAKLYRYDKDLKQWKERGIGEMKILTGAERSRIVMRRDHIHKLCANHLITVNMTLTAQNSNRSWMWHTLADISEEVPREELLAVRFKTAEQAQEFKKKFEECRDAMDPTSTANGESASDSSGQSSERENSSVEDDEQVTNDNHGSDAGGIQTLSSSTSQSKEALPLTDRQQVSATGSPLKPPQSEFLSVTTVKKEVRQQFSSSTSGGQTLKQSAVAKSYREQKVAETGGTRTEENQEVSSLALQEQRVTSSSADKPSEFPSFQFGAQGMAQPSTFSQELMSRQQSQPFTFDQQLPVQGGILFGRPSIFPPSSMDLPYISQTFDAFSSTERPSSSQVASSEQTETRTVEATPLEVSSSEVTTSEREMVSCLPEITKLLQEIEDKSDNIKE